MNHLVVLSFWSEFWTAFKHRIIEEVQIGDIGFEIEHAIAPKILFSFNFLGQTVVISDVITVSWIALVVIAVLGWLMGRKRDQVPHTGRQLISESLVDILLKLCQNTGMTYEQAERVVPFVGTIGIFITLTNLSSMFKIPPPAKNPAFPIALALLTIVYVIIMSIRFVGLRGFWASLIYPKAMLLPFKILDFLIKPISLSLRLFGNIFGAYILMEFIYIIIPVFIPGIVGLWFDLADGILQGIIFTYLTATYIGEIVENAHEAEHARQARITAHSHAGGKT
ncbi:MAG: FoF1 ATP synthase subunit a [Bacillota bacterium]|nr:FoF1 ATP synthase subunit a [Bacillota bacterium]